MKIKLNKSQWLSMGKQAGWTGNVKTAQVDQDDTSMLFDDGTSFSRQAPKDVNQLITTREEARLALRNIYLIGNKFVNISNDPGGRIEDKPEVKRKVSSFLYNNIETVENLLDPFDDFRLVVGGVLSSVDAFIKNWDESSAQQMVQSSKSLIRRLTSPAEMNRGSKGSFIPE
jgi:hypothetical protein